MNFCAQRDVCAGSFQAATEGCVPSALHRCKRCQCDRALVSFSRRCASSLSINAAATRTKHCVPVALSIVCPSRRVPMDAACDLARFRFAERLRVAAAAAAAPSADGDRGILTGQDGRANYLAFSRPCFCAHGRGAPLVAARAPLPYAGNSLPRCTGATGTQP